MLCIICNAVLCGHESSFSDTLQFCRHSCNTPEELLHVHLQPHMGSSLASLSNDCLSVRSKPCVDKPQVTSLAGILGQHRMQACLDDIKGPCANRP